MMDSIINHELLQNVVDTPSHNQYYACSFCVPILGPNLLEEIPH